MAGGNSRLLLLSVAVWLLHEAGTTDTSDVVGRNLSLPGYQEARATTTAVVSPLKQLPSPQAPLCDLHPWETELHEEIAAARAKGTVQLLKYKLNFRDKEDYPGNPLTTNMTSHFKADRWQSVFTKHGRTLLSLAFNYDALSLLMLTFGVEEVTVGLVDSPAGCFGKLNETNKISKMRQLIMNDFQIYNEEGTPMGNDEELCHQVIRDVNGAADFTFECCRVMKESGHIECHEAGDHPYIDALSILMTVIKIGFLLFGPVLLQGCFYSDRGELRKSSYVVKLSKALRKTLLVKKVASDNTVNPGQQKEMKQFRKFRELLKSIPSDEVVPVRFKKLHILVDHHQLMSEKKVPVGLFYFLYSTFLRCGIRRYEPFAACCKASIFGTWSPRFLWLPLKRESDCNRSCATFLSWHRLFRMLGALVIVAAIPLPYYLRIILYWRFEEEEINLRKAAAEKLGLDIIYNHNLFQYLTPTHGVMIALYIIYSLAFVFLACFRFCNSEEFDDLVRGAVQDLRSIKRMECLRLLVAHLVLPLEKFGLCGCFIGLVYWPLALPICLLVSVCYSVPSLYLTGRFCVHRRPSFLATKPWSSRMRRKTELVTTQTLSEGTSSFETAMLLENISPRDVDRASSPKKQVKEKCYTCNTQKWCSKLVTLLVGVLCVLYMHCLLLMFTECFGVAVEIFVFTMMGTIVNASSAARYVMLAFWIIMYSTSCYNRSYSKYAKLNHKLFEFIKGKLNEDVEAVTLYREEKQKNTAFKFFTVPELRRMHDRDVEVDVSSEEDLSDPAPADKPGASANVNRREKYHFREDAYEDSVEFLNGKLCWKVNCLTFFVDKKDRPRIPVELFARICEIKAPGCPGPVHESLIKATKQLMYMIIFLVFVFLVVLSFGDFYEISTTNQMLLTLTSGFVPFVIRFVLTPKVAELNLNTYSFSGKIHHIIRNFNQTWPVYDLSFKCWSPDIGGGPFPPGASGGSPGGTAGAFGERGGRAPDVIDPSHVDLLITIKDDNDDDIAEHRNLRSEPGSLGSISSGLVIRSSPEDPSRPFGASSNNPTNATLLQRSASAGTPEQGAVGGASAYPKHISISAPPRKAPEERRVDLVVDISKGRVQIHKEQPLDRHAGIAMRPLDVADRGSCSPCGKETESAL